MIPDFFIRPEKYTIRVRTLPRILSWSDQPTRLTPLSFLSVFPLPRLLGATPSFVLGRRWLHRGNIAFVLLFPSSSSSSFPVGLSFGHDITEALFASLSCSCFSLRRNKSGRNAAFVIFPAVEESFSLSFVGKPICSREEVRF